MIYSLTIYSQKPDTLPDCNNIKRGECIQYLDSLFKPTIKENAVYKRYNYKFSKHSFIIDEMLWSKEVEREVLGRNYRKDTIVFVDGIYKWYRKGVLDYEVHYRNGYPDTMILYNSPVKNEYIIDNYNEQYNNERWSFSCDGYKDGNLIKREYYRIRKNKYDVYKIEKFGIDN